MSLLFFVIKASFCADIKKKNLRLGDLFICSVFLGENIHFLNEVFVGVA
jgi:hypothetical protein